MIYDGISAARAAITLVTFFFTTTDKSKFKFLK
jgi:hypothetical protein